MATKSYSEKLKDPRWQRKRLEIMDRDGFKCAKCGDDKDTLHIHHLKYNGANPWDIDNENLITVCSTCHTVMEYVKKSEMQINVLEDKFIKKCASDGSCSLFVIRDNYVPIFSLENGEIIYISSYYHSTIKEIASHLK